MPPRRSSRPPASGGAPEEFPEGNSEIVSKGPCDKCGSSDGNHLYADAHAFCYVCKTYTPPPPGGPGGGAGVVPAGLRGAVPAGGPGDGNAGGRGGASRGAGLFDPAAFPNQKDGLPERGLSHKTLQRYGYFRAAQRGEKLHVWSLYEQEGALAGQRVRKVASKDFFFIPAYEGAPSPSKCRLFGHHVYGDRFDRRVVICEGEIDCMSVAEAIDFKAAVVSLNGGVGGAVKDLQANYLWLDRFQEIVLWFDADEPGQKAVQDCAPLFKVGKVRVVQKAGQWKDASDIMQAGRPGDITEAVHMAVGWRPRGIVNARDRVKDIMAPTERTVAYSYPPSMPKLQEMTGGMAPGDVIYDVGGTGIGKSAVIREIIWHLVEQGVKVGVLSFEDTVRDMQFGIMSIPAGERLHLVPVPDPDDAAGREAYDSRMVAYHKATFGTGLIELFDPETAEWEMEAIIGYIRYLARALDCAVVVVDPISFVAAGVDLMADERRTLDKVAMELAKLAKELGIHIRVVHHLKRTSGTPHEEGAPTSLNELRSSGGLANFAMGVIGWERNNQAPDDSWRVMQGRIIKPLRRTGRSGLADVLYYTEQGRLIPSQIPFPEPGKPEGAGGAAAGGGGRSTTSVSFSGADSSY